MIILEVELTSITKGLGDERREKFLAKQSY